MFENSFISYNFCNLGHAALEVKGCCCQLSVLFGGLFGHDFASEYAYKLGLKSRILCDFSAVPVAVDVRCDGAKEACDALLAHLDWLIDYINSPSATRWETP